MKTIFQPAGYKSCAAILVVIISPILVNAMAVPIPDPLEQPCGVSGLTAVSNFTSLTLSMLNKANEIRYASEKFKGFMLGNDTTNIRVTRNNQEQCAKATVSKFPYDFMSDFSPNVTQVLKKDYVFLSKLYIFFEQIKLNIKACDRGSDASTGIARVENLLTATLGTLCQVNIYLYSKGQPKADDLPTRDSVLTGCFPEVRDLDRCGAERNNGRNIINYVLARDAVATSTHLYNQYESQLNALQSNPISNNSSG